MTVTEQELAAAVERAEKEFGWDQWVKRWTKHTCDVTKGYDREAFLGEVVAMLYQRLDLS